MSDQENVEVLERTCGPLKDRCIYTNGLLIGLYLGHLDLEVLPPEIGMFEQLEELDIYANLIKKLPPELGRLRALKKLNLSLNQLEVLPLEIGTFEQLEELDISHNLIKK